MAVRRFRITLQQIGHDTRKPFIMEMEISCESSDVVRRANAINPEYRYIGHILLE